MNMSLACQDTIAREKCSLNMCNVGMDFDLLPRLFSRRPRSLPFFSGFVLESPLPLYGKGPPGVIEDRPYMHTMYTICAMLLFKLELREMGG